jgi:hypothetical protein
MLVANPEATNPFTSRPEAKFTNASATILLFINAFELPLFGITWP